MKLIVKRILVILSILTESQMFLVACGGDSASDSPGVSEDGNRNVEDDGPDDENSENNEEENNENEGDDEETVGFATELFDADFYLVAFNDGWGHSVFEFVESGKLVFGSGDEQLDGDFELQANNRVLRIDWSYFGTPYGQDAFVALEEGEGVYTSCYTEGAQETNNSNLIANCQSADAETWVYIVATEQEADDLIAVLESI